MRFIKTSVLVAAALCATVSAQAQGKGKRTAKAKATTAAPVDMPTTLQAPARDAEVRRGLRFEAFVDANARLTSKEDLFNGAAVPERGFLINDAALYVSKEFGNNTAFIDLPFNSSNDRAGATSAPNSGFLFAVDKAQAYLAHDRGSLVFKFGQYDTFYGVEANDSRDRFFTEEGLVKHYILPSTHTGVQGAFIVDNAQTKLTFRGQIANPNGQGLLGKDNPEFGLQGRVDAGPIYGAFGLSIHESKTAATDKTGMLIDVMGGFAADKLRIEAEFDNKKTPGVSKSTTAFLVLGSFAIDDTLGLGGRFEYAKDVAVGANNGFETLMGFAFGPSYKMAEDLTLRGDVNFTSAKPVGGASEESFFGVTFSAVATL